MAFKFRLLWLRAWGATPTQPSIGGVTIGSTQSSHRYEGCGGHEKFWGEGPMKNFLLTNFVM